MKKGFFICITGIDGSGKTTQARLLANELADNYARTEYVYARFTPILLRPILAAVNSIFLSGTTDEEDYQARTEEKIGITQKHKILSSLYYSVLLLDYTIQLLFKIRIPLRRGVNIVCDRYIFDTVVTDIAVDFSLSKGEMISLVERLLEMLPIPDLVILLDIDEQIAFSRKNDVASMSYLIDRRSRYQELASAFPFFIVINADRDPNEIKLEILSCIRARMGDIQ